MIVVGGMDAEAGEGFGVGEVVAVAEVLDGVAAFVAAAAAGFGAEAGPALLAVEAAPVFEVVAAA